MPLDFPNSPTNGQVFNGDGVSWKWDGVKWTSVLSSGGPFLPLSGGTVTGPLNYTATGGTTVRSAQDRAAELVNVRDFGAKGDGTTNDTAAFNAAMGVAYNSPHACIVTIPSGLYLLDPLLVPDSVVLQGVVPGPLDPTTGFLTTPIGATLLVNSHAREFITLAGRSGLHDVIIYDPGQVAPTATAPNVYPATVFMNAVCRVSGLTICNAYDGIWVRSGRCWVENCYIGAYHTAVDIDSCADATYLNNIFCSVFYDTCLGLFPWQNMDNWVMNNNGVAFKFGRADAVSMMNCVAFIKWCGIFINDGTGPNPGQAYGSCANFHVDTCVYGAIIYSTNASAGWQFSNFTALPTNGAPQPNSITPLAMPTGGVSAPHVSWTGGAIGFSAAKWSNPAPIVNAGWLQVVNVNLLTDGVVTPSMDGTAAVGTSLVLAKADHVHPTDTSRLARSGGTMSGQLTMANQQPFRFTDASGSTATGFVLQSDNNFVLAGSSSTGAARNIASMVQHSDTSTFNWIAPVIFGATATFNVNSGFANGIWLEWFDTGGAAALMGLMPDNTLNWYGTNATGAVRLIMQMQQRSSTSAAGWSVPMQFISTVGFNNTTPIAKPTVSGAKGSNAALASLLTALAAYGLITDSTTA